MFSQQGRLLNSFQSVRLRPPSHRRLGGLGHRRRRRDCLRAPDSLVLKTVGPGFEPTFRRRPPAPGLGPIRGRGRSVSERSSLKTKNSSPEVKIWNNGFRCFRGCRTSAQGPE